MKKEPKLVIEAQIPQGSCLIYKDGVLMQNLKEFEFFAEVDGFPYYVATYGTYFDNLVYSDLNMNCRIESDGTSMGTFIYINGEKQKFSQKVYFKFNEFSNELKLTKFFFDKE